MKKIFTTAFLLLAALMLKAQTFNAGDWWFTVTDADTRQVELTLYPEAALAGDIMIPGTATHEGVETIGQYAFAYCSPTAIMLPESLGDISSNAFYGCTSLAAINVTENNASYTADDGVLFSKDKTVILRYPCAKAGTSYTIPEGVTKISASAFQSCTALTAVTIPESVTTIELGAFENCTGLKEATLPNGITEIADFAFSICENLEKANIPEGVTSIGYCAFQGCEKLKEISLPESLTTIGESAFGGCFTLANVVIPAGVTEIGINAFANCYAFTEITVPDGIKAINNMAFWSCENLERIHLPAGLESIGDEAFSWCYKLSAITIPESVKSIGSEAFSYCTSLASVNIPASVASIGELTFYGCSSLNKATVMAVDPPALGSQAFESTDPALVCYVSSASVDKYKSAQGWSELNIEGIDLSINSVTMPESITAGNGVLNNPEGLEITVYDTAGLEIYKGRDTSLTLNGGVYIIHCGKSVKKMAF